MKRAKVLRHTHTPEQLDAFAKLSESDTSDSLLDHARDAATALLNFQGSFTVGEVRQELERRGILANDGKEQLGALGSLGRSMGCVSLGIERQIPALAMSHGHHVTRWARPGRFSHSPQE